MAGVHRDLFVTGFHFLETNCYLCLPHLLSTFCLVSFLILNSSQLDLLRRQVRMGPPRKTQKLNSGIKIASAEAIINEAPYERYQKSALEQECKRRELESNGTRNDLEARLKEHDLEFGTEQTKQKWEENPEYIKVRQERDELKKERDELLTKSKAVVTSRITRQSPSVESATDTIAAKTAKVAEVDLVLQKIQQIQAEFETTVTGYEQRFDKAVTTLENCTAKAFTAVNQLKAAEPTIPPTAAKQSIAPATKTTAKDNTGNISISSNSELDSDKESDWDEDGIDLEDEDGIDLEDEDGIVPEDKDSIAQEARDLKEDQSKEDLPGEEVPPMTVFTVDHHGNIAMFAGSSSQLKILSGSKGHKTEIGPSGGHSTSVPAELAPTSLYITSPFSLL